MAGRRKMGVYFKRFEGMPEPLVARVKRRVNLSEADVLGIVWHGRYAKYFEDGAAELGRQCGLSYRDFRDADLRAPIVQFHVDYHLPLLLDEEFTVIASLIWSEGARLNMEFELIRQDSKVAATGYTVQMFVDGATGETCLVSPELLERCRRRWLAGEFQCLR
jgi:acyl-CoA thioester hydrolase